jgi:hypothetical protein
VDVADRSISYKPITDIMTSLPFCPLNQPVVHGFRGAHQQVHAVPHAVPL